jgi:anti-sigma-K factor RskA
MSHLTPEQLLDVAEETRARTEFPHVSACPACQRQVAELRDMMAATAAVEMPEPSPLFWDHLSARVREAVATEEIAGAPGWWVRWAAWRVAATAVAVAVLVLMISTLGRDDAPSDPVGAVQAVVEYAPVEELVPFEADPALAALADLSAELDWDAASEAGLVPTRGTVDKVVLALEPEERLALQRILEEALAGSGA